MSRPVQPVFAGFLRVVANFGSVPPFGLAHPLVFGPTGSTGRSGPVFLTLSPSWQLLYFIQIVRQISLILIYDNFVALILIGFTLKIVVTVIISYSILFFKP